MATPSASRIMSEQKLYSYNNLFPKVHESVFLAPGVKIIGDVEIAEQSSIWFNSVARGDIHYIKIGSYSNIQDCCVLHVTNDKYSLNIGNWVTVGHSVNLHGCTVNDHCLIGMGAILLDGSIVEQQAMVAAGSVVKQGFLVPSGKLVAGVPAKIIRDLTKDEIQEMRKSAESYIEYAKIMAESLNPTNYF